MAHFQVQAPMAVMFGAAKKKAAPKKAKAADATPMAAPSPVSVYKEPTHGERLHSAAKDEHVYAARDFVAGRINHKQYQDRKRRSEKVMSETPKSKK